MKRLIPPRISAGKTLVIAFAVGLLLLGCSKREESSKADQRVSTGTTGKTNQTIPDWAAEGSDTGTNARALAPWELDYDTNNKGYVVLEPELTPKELAELRSKAEKGDAESQYRLAQVFGRGEGVHADDTESFKWRERAAESGHAEAAYDLAFAYRHGFLWGVKTNASLALRWLKVASERGHISAQRALATSFRSSSSSGTSWGTGQDSAEAARWYQKAAEQGDASAKFTLGEMYLHGEGVPTNTSEGLRLVEDAIAGFEAELREMEASTNLSNLSATDRALFVKSTTEVVALKCWKLADYFYEGKSVPKNITNAVHWYEKAAGLPNSETSGQAQFQLGYIHFTETKNFTEAAKWFRKQAEAGNPQAQHNLGALYYDGNGVERDWKEAANWFRAAADQDYPDAQYNLGRMCGAGEGLPRDDAQAVNWMRKAAEQGYPAAQNDLGVACAEGRGIPRDYVEAYKWYNLAAASSQTEESRENSRKNVNLITRHMTPDQIAEAQRRSTAFVARKSLPSWSPPNSDQVLPRPEREEFTAEDSMPKATGTAFFITDDGYLLTSAHVVSPTATKTAKGYLDARPITKIEVIVAGKTHPAKLVKLDKANDVAVLKVTGNFIPLPLAPSRAAKLGESICTFGFPNTEIQGIEPKFTTGEINSLTGIQDDPRHFQISVPVQPGNSGGPLLDSSGNVIGIVNARLGDIATLKITGSLPQNVNYALKSSFITAFLETPSDVSAKLKSARPAKVRPLAEIAAEAKPSVVLVTVY